MFEVKISYTKTFENGKIKTVKEKYVVDSMSVTEAEVRTLEYLSYLENQELEVKEAKAFKVAEIIKNIENQEWFKAKIVIITIGERSGAEKKTKMNILVQAESVNDAIEVIHKHFKNSISDYIIDSVSTTQIVDFISSEE